MGLAALAEEAMTQAKDADGAGQDGGVLGRAIPSPRQQGRDLLVALALVSELEDLFLHRLGRGQPGQGPDRHRQCCGRRVASSPDDADLQGVRGGAMDDDLVDEAAEEGLLLLRRQAVLTPELRDRLAGPEEGFSFLGTEPLRGSGLLLLVPEPLLGVLEFPQRRFPTPLQLGGHQAVVRVGLVVLPLGQAGLVAEPLDLLPLRLLHLLSRPGGGRPRPCHRGPIPPGTGRRGRPGRRARRWDRRAGSGRRARGTAGEDSCRYNGIHSCTARPSCARTPRSRRCRGAGPCRAGAPPGSCCGRIRCSCRGPWPGFSQKCPSRCRPDTCPGGRPSTGPWAAASARAGGGHRPAGRPACGRRRRRRHRRGS